MISGMKRDTVTYAHIVTLLGSPHKTAMDSAGLRYEWACGCHGYCVTADQCVVLWCGDHEAAV
ncbi:MAG TPA: hypothetical protein VGZ02_00835 [Candidatus Baltobacteraceae bacterium]|jgi:hypothetical protein|nr:hypothetical protein [Candidatus Baltobacteraceae bacterium]